MNAIKLFAALILSILCATAWADPCDDKVTQVDLNECYGNEYKVAQKELDQVYHVLRASLSDRQRQKAFEAVQAAWLKYRDLHCKFEVSVYEGGSMYSMLYAICLTEKTRARFVELKKMAACDDSDVSCSSM